MMIPFLYPRRGYFRRHDYYYFTESTMCRPCLRGIIRRPSNTVGSNRDRTKQGDTSEMRIQAWKEIGRIIVVGMMRSMERGREREKLKCLRSSSHSSSHCMISWQKKNEKTIGSGSIVVSIYKLCTNWKPFFERERLDSRNRGGLDCSLRRRKCRRNRVSV